MVTKTLKHNFHFSATDRFLIRASAGAGDGEEGVLTAAGRAILDDVDAPAQRTTLGLGTIATQNANNVTISGGAITGTTIDGVSIKSYVDSLIQGLKWKQSVIAATTANGSLATAYENGDTIDGVTLTTGDRILIKDQTTATENGIYTVNASGAPTRATDADTGTELVAATMYVEQGTANADKAFTCTNNSITLGSTNIVFVNLASSLGAVTNVTASGALASSGGTTPNITLTDVELLAIAALTSAADQLPYFTGSGTAALTTLTSFVRTLLDDTSAAAFRTTLGIGTYSGEEVPTGTINGSNTVFTLANTPIAGSLELYKNGAYMKLTSGEDYSLSTNTITFVAAQTPQSSPTTDVIIAKYRF